MTRPLGSSPFRRVNLKVQCYAIRWAGTLTGLLVPDRFSHSLTNRIQNGALL